jgi:Domain of unknown function (DUF1906)
LKVRFVDPNSCHSERSEESAFARRCSGTGFASVLCTVATLAAIVALVTVRTSLAQNQAAPNAPTSSAPAYLGFDANEYPGNAALPRLKQTFSFSGFWLNNPPGAKSNPWVGKRATVRENGFGFLVLFNGRIERQLDDPAGAAALGASDAVLAIRAAGREGFPTPTVIFLDQEEGGRLDLRQLAYLYAWIDGVNAAGFRAGVYCSGIPVKEGKKEFIVTADQIRESAGDRDIAFFVYNDACPPSPGCIYGKNPPPPALSGVSFASLWQFAQSPRRREFTARCSSTYNRDGNCYPPGAKGPGSLFLDLDSATSPDPSAGR